MVTPRRNPGRGRFKSHSYSGSCDFQEQSKPTHSLMFVQAVIGESTLHHDHDTIHYWSFSALLCHENATSDDLKPVLNSTLIQINWSFVDKCRPFFSRSKNKITFLLRDNKITWSISLILHWNSSMLAVVSLITNITVALRPK